MNDWFTSDLHFFHKNIVKFTNRGVDTDVESHNEWLIHLWNSTVKPGDRVWHLGDFSFAKDVRKTLDILDRLNGQKFFFKGNHDHSDNFKAIRESGKVAGAYEYKEHKFDVNHICMFHFPIASWHRQHHGSWHLHGHSHGSYKQGKGKILDVGIDNAFMMYNKHKFFHLDEIEAYMDTRPIYIADEHRNGDL